MFTDKKISLVIPCYNEEEGIKNMLNDVPSFADEVIIVDNGSTDNTALYARQKGATIIYESRKGYGYAHKAGLSRAKGDIIVLLDGDNSYPLFEIEKLLAYLETENLDFVSGCRYPLLNKNAQPLINKIANYFISGFIRILFKTDIRDSQSGMMAFNRAVLDKIKIYNTGMGFSQEIKIKAFLHPAIRCGQVPICYFPRLGKVKFRKTDAVNNLHSALCLWLEHRRTSLRANFS